ncbi:unnamed protein product [Amaranthus hypochondriacus]
MEDPHEEDFLDVDQLISLEALVELYYDEHEEMQDQDYEHYESDNENMQGDNEANQMTMGNTIDVRTKKFVRTCPKPREFSDAFLQSVSLYLRQIERSYAAALNISHVTLHNLKKKGRIRTHTCSSKPALTSNHKIDRMKWVLSHINPITANEDPTFVSMNNVVHIDEKWFYLSPDKRRFYLLPDEEDPYMAQQSKRFKLKAMFIAVIGKPLYDIHGGLIHDGKYGIFPFTVKEMAKKSSKNRAVDTLVTKAL